MQASRIWMTVSDVGHEIERFQRSLIEAEAEGKSVDMIVNLQHQLYTRISIVIPHLQPIPESRLVIFCFHQVARRPAPFSSCKEF